ncbi:glycoside hydrolase family protein [Flavivirga rizhaonensis]|uniref:Uncharacterized protein n=1 Tax=Flavivirga rizhaonensis TaxID=2559571 RepID=A0A4S1DRZ7_9FLAO|nr:hypothetical protein [Flavivirga rizhaonensis]TGV00716.1 hypothetical protein EM932_18655 [Flavivirga rizhaonensis]
MMKNKVLFFVVFSLLVTITGVAQIQEKNISDIEVSSPRPYRYEGAGYNEVAIDKLPIFKLKKGGNSEELNKLIAEVSKKGGGVIKIPSGAYNFMQILLKSNVHIRIAKNTVIEFPENSGNKKGEKSIIMIGRLANEGRIKNVSIVGEGSLTNRPKFILRQVDIKHRRVFSIGSVENLLIENFTIEDNETKGSAIAFNLQRKGDSKAYRAKGATVANISMTGIEHGYALVQNNVGENILLKNLICENGVTCRVETHSARPFNVGIDNIVIQNIVNKHGKAAVLLQPHSVVNGRVIVEGVKSIGSVWTVFLKEGFVAKDSKRRENGVFIGSKISGISMVYSNTKAVLSRRNVKNVPDALKQFISEEDRNIKKFKVIDPSIIEKGVPGPSIAPVFSNVKTYSVELPNADEIRVSGEDVHLRKVKFFRID